MQSFWDRQHHSRPGLNFCCRFLASCLLFFGLIFIIGAVVSPWHFIAYQTPKTDGEKRTLAYIAYWDGFRAVSQGYDDSPSDRKWSDVNGEQLKNLYTASGVLSVFALFPTVALFLLLFLSFFDPFNRCMYRFSCGWLNIYAIILALSMLILANLAWGVFLRWPYALDESTLCVPFSGKYFCSNFMGSQAEVGKTQIDLTWGPFFGWWLALLGGACSFLAVGLMCCVGLRNRDRFFEEYSEYSIQGM